MVRIYQGVNDDMALALLEKANQIYPLDPRIHEHLGVVFANYQGTIPISVDARIERLEWVLKGDPWGANHLVNLAGQYLQRVQVYKSLTNPTPEQVALLNKDLARLDEIYERLQQVADFSHYTWSTGGMVRLFQGRPEEAMALFRRALAIQPGYGPAMNGLGMATKLLAQMGVSPVVVQDGILKQ
jgi:tetratricopeptide (TPR) repeat protein